MGTGVWWKSRETHAKLLDLCLWKIRKKNIGEPLVFQVCFAFVTNWLKLEINAVFNVAFTSLPIHIYGRRLACIRFSQNTPSRDSWTGSRISGWCSDVGLALFSYNSLWVWALEGCGVNDLFTHCEVQRVNTSVMSVLLKTPRGALE